MDKINKENNKIVCKDPRDLSKAELELLTVLLHKHNGHFSRVIKDKTSPVKSAGNIYFYEKKYKLKNRLEKYRINLLTEYKEELKSKLSKGKIKAIERALELLEERDIDIVNKDGELITIRKVPTYKEIETAWNIIKTELGEPVKIKESINNLDDEVKKLLQENKIVFVNFKKDETKGK